jgi:hypothetical protein
VKNDENFKKLPSRGSGVGCRNPSGLWDGLKNAVFMNWWPDITGWTVGNSRRELDRRF